jgi:hypothetical protein
MDDFSSWLRQRIAETAAATDSVGASPTARPPPNQMPLAHVPPPSTAQNDSRASTPSPPPVEPQNQKKRTLYSINDKIRILKRMQDYSNRHPNKPLQTQLKVLNLSHIGYSNAKLWMDTCDEIYTAQRLGYGSRYRLKAREREHVQRELLKKRCGSDGEEASASAEALAEDVEAEDKEDIDQRHMSHNQVGIDFNTDDYNSDDEEFLGAIIYRSSLTAKLRREAASQIGKADI